MSGTELKILEIIWNWGGEASIDTIAREARISTDYARLICQNLGRNNYIDFTHSKLCFLRGMGKLEVARRKVDKPKKIVIPEKIPGFGLGKDRKGRFLLEY
jgi:Mn-dependent DtxR family transcriptional regulator